jgi:hypothetical protein
MIERDPIVLMKDIAQAGFEFLGRDESGVITGWSAAWDTPGVLPVAVRLDLELPENSRSVWPILMAGVKVDELAVSQSGGRRNFSDAMSTILQRPGEPVQ